MRFLSLFMLVRVAIAVAVASGLALIAVVIEFSGQPESLPNRLPVLIFVGVLLLLFQASRAQVFNNKFMFFVGVILIFGAGLLLTGGCIPGGECKVWGQGFRLQHTVVSVISLCFMISLTLYSYRWSKDELINFFQRVVIGVIVFLPLSIGMLEISLDDPQLSSYLLLYTAILLMSLVLALVTMNLTSDSIDLHSRQTFLHGFIPVGFLCIFGLMVALMLSSETRQFIFATAQFIFSTIMALVALVIGLFAIVMQWLIGDMSQRSPGLPTQTPPPLGPSPLDGFSEKVAELSQPPQSTPLAMYVIQAVVVCVVLLLIFFFLKKFSQLFLASQFISSATEQRESIWSWGNLREELADLLPRFKRSTAQEPTTPNRQRIRELYRRMLARAQRHDLERKPSTTPRAFGQTLKTQLNTQAVEQLTTLYEQARYGPEPRSSDVDAAKAAFDSLEDS